MLQKKLNKKDKKTLRDKLILITCLCSSRGWDFTTRMRKNTKKALNTFLGKYYFVLLLPTVPLTLAKVV